MYCPECITILQFLLKELIGGIGSIGDRKKCLLLEGVLVLNDEEISFIFIKYIHRTLVNQANKYYQKKSVYSRDLVYEENLTESELKELSSIDYKKKNDPFIIFDSRETGKRIEHNFEKLSSDDKQLLFDKYIESRSDREIALKLGISSQAVSKRKRKILSKLRKDI